MSISVTNQIASQALRGQSVKVTLDSTDSAQLVNLQIGDYCTINSGSSFGTICSIDEYGNSFQITPLQPDLTCVGSVAGYLGAADSIAIA